MADDRDITEVLYDIKLKGSVEAYRQFNQLDKQIDDSLKALRTMGQDDSLDSVHKRAAVLVSTATNLSRSLGEAHAGFNVLGKDGKTIQKLTSLTEDLSVQFESLLQAQKEGNTDLAKSIKENIQLKEKELRLETQKGLKNLDKQKKRLQEIYEIRKKSSKVIAQDVGRGGMEILNALKGQDIGTALRTLGGGGRGAGLFAQGAGGERLSEARKNLAAKGVQNVRDVKGVGGQIANAGKFVSSGAGGQYAMAQMLLTIGKLATAATAVVGIFAALAKILYDAYAQAKRFNGEILKTQGITALMPTQMMGTAEGLALAEERLNKIRKLATNFDDNFKLDLKPEDMFAFANALDEAGIPAKRLRDYATDLRMMLNLNQISAKNLGVGLNEVNTFTASYMDTLDADLQQVRSTLAYITDDAQKSGMSTKRFFQIIQNASGDMALYNYRISEASTLLRGISKYMDAKSAEEFMNNLGKGLTQMSQTDRLKTLALAGGGNVAQFGKSLKREARASLGDLSAEQRAEAITRLQSMGIQADNTNLEDKLLGLDAKQLGGLSGISGYRQIEKANLMNRNAGKGALGIAAASADAGSLFQVEALLKSAEAVGSIENIDDIIGTQLVGGDEKKFRMMRSFAIQTRGQNARLQEAAKKGPEELARVQSEMGFEGLSANEKGQLVGKDGNVIKNEFDLLRNLGARQKDELGKIEESQRSSAEKTVELTKNVLDAIELGMTKVLNDIYQAVLDIRNFMLDPLGEDSKSQVGAFKVQERDLTVQLQEAQAKQGKATSAQEAKAAQSEVEKISANLRSVRARKMFAEQGITGKSVLDSSYAMMGGKEEVEIDLLARSDKYMKEQTLDFTDLEDVQKDAVDLMGQKGIKLDPQTMQEVAKKMAIETVVAQQAVEFSKKTGLNIQQSTDTLRKAYFTGEVGDLGANTDKVKGVLKDMNVPIAGDVRMATSGIPLLNMKAGDVVIDSSSLAATGYGAPGSLLRTTGLSGASSAMSGAGSVFAPVIHMPNGDRQLQDKLMRMLEQFYRAEVLGSG